MDEKNKKTLIIVGIIATIFIIILACILSSLAIYFITKKDKENKDTIIDEYIIEPTENEEEILPNEDLDNNSLIDTDEKNNIQSEGTSSINDKNEVISANGIKNINQVDLFDAEEVETFSAGSAKFIIYPLKDIAAGQDEGYFETYQDINLIYTSEKLYNITNIFSFEFGVDTYIVVTAYSGGAHCCFTQYIFHKDQDNAVNLVRELVTGNSTLSADNFFVENGKLYFSVMDDRFAYFYTSYASSYSFVRFFQLDGNNISDANSNFSDEFLQEAGRCEAELDSINPADIYSMEDWFPTLVCKSSNYWYAGDQNSAWSGFNDYFSRFDAAENPNDIRTEMENVLNQPY